MSEDTHELEDVVAKHLPKRWKPEYGRRWLVARLNSGELTGVRWGRWDWTMRDKDVDHMLNRYANDGQAVTSPTPPPSGPEPATVADGLSARSRRRLRSV